MAMSNDCEVIVGAYDPLFCVGSMSAHLKRAKTPAFDLTMKQAYPSVHDNYMIYNYAMFYWDDVDKLWGV